jgi:hypothetical protein
MILLTLWSMWMGCWCSDEEGGEQVDVVEAGDQDAVVEEGDQDAVVEEGRPDEGGIDPDILEFWRQEELCSRGPEPVSITPGPPVTDLPSLCVAFREQPDVARRVVGCEWAASESDRLWSIDVERRSIVRARLAGLGVAVGLEDSSVPATPEEVSAVGVDPASLEVWLRVASSHRVRRIERWGVVIADPYHGQPGLVVRTDVGFLIDGVWKVCMDESTTLLDEHVPVPPGGLKCVEEQGGWWTCK